MAPLRFPAEMPVYRHEDPRLSALLYSEELDDDRTDADIVLLGFPFDEGVLRNGGRKGAGKGPSAVRAALPSVGPVFNPELGIGLEKGVDRERHVDLDEAGEDYLKIFDAGDVPSHLSLEDAHRFLERAVRDVLLRGQYPVVVGGGDDQSLPNVTAFLKTLVEERFRGSRKAERSIPRMLSGSRRKQCVRTQLQDAAVHFFRYGRS